MDLGTNTFNLLIIEKNNDPVHKLFRILYNEKIAVKLGEGGITENTIRPIPFNRGIEAIGNHKQIIKDFNIEEIIVLATSAIREATNGHEFVRSVKEKYDLDIKIIDGDKEAFLIYNGVIHSLEMDESPDLIIDIGGGSVEFIIANKQRLFWEKSVKIGMARMLEIFKPSNPITEKEITQIEQYLQDHLHCIDNEIKKYNFRGLIGSSGSFDTLAEIIIHRFYQPGILKEKTTFNFDLHHYNIIHQDLLSSTREERIKMKGMEEMRVDMIVLASILINFILKKGLKEMRLSTYALKEGVIFQILEKGNLLI